MKNRIRQVLFIGAINFVWLSVFSQNIKEIEKLKKIIYTLADDSMQGRAAESEGGEKAKRFLVNYFKETDLSPFNSSYIQEFTFPKDSTHNDTAFNLFCFIDNKADSTIIIGAHYDHIGMGGEKSRSFTSNKIHNGADDNASGVAMMLLLAGHFSTPLLTPLSFGEGPGVRSGGVFNYMFIAFSAHELGLYGSNAFVDEKIYDLSKVKLMVNFDMVGRLDTTNPILKVIRSEKDFYLDTLLNCASHQGFQLKIDENNLTRTDASAFTNSNIPAITFSTGTHDDYHKVSDDAEKINYEGMVEIFLFVKDFLRKLP